MAESKKSFLLYCDLIHTVSKMPDDKAGLLFKHLLMYVNDKNPDTEDLIIQLTFEPIKQQLKRDLVKYGETVEGRSKAGKASAEARKLAKEKQQKSTNPTSVDFVQQKSTNPTDSVNDNVSVTDTVKDNVKDKEIINNDVFKENLLKNENWIKTIATESKKTEEEVKQKLEGFIVHLATELKIHPSVNEFAKHFKYWLPKNIIENGKSNSSSKSNSNNGYKPAKVDRERLVRELADDAANGNIPGDYSKERFERQARASG
jgi:hypothetical protein